MGTPFKPATMTKGADLTNVKHVYLKKSGGGANFYDASDVIAQKRRMAVGKNTTRVTVPNGNPSSNSNFVQNDVKSALAKVRGGGARVPPKVGMSAIKKVIKSIRICLCIDYLASWEVIVRVIDNTRTYHYNNKNHASLLCCG